MEHPHTYKIGDTVRFEQNEQMVSGIVESFNGQDYYVTLSQDAGILKKGTTIAVAASAITS